MSDSELTIHYVCTFDQACRLIEANERFWVSNCGCRESRGHCERSRIDVCLMFRDDSYPSGSDMKELSKELVVTLLEEVKTKHLVCRPFRYMKNPSETEGICFCCDDCCGYFLDPTQKCDKGTMIENTTMEECSLCGICVEHCFFKARTIEKEVLHVHHHHCYGCGLCADVCPENCVKMLPR